MPVVLPPSPRPLLRRAAFALLAASLVAVACSSASDDTSAPNTATPTTSNASVETAIATAAPTTIVTTADEPIVAVMSDQGFEPHPSLAESNDGTVSLETATGMGADLVATQVRGIAYDSLTTDPLWATTSAATSSNQFERFQFGQQGRWLEMLAPLDRLAVELPRDQPGG